MKIQQHIVKIVYMGIFCITLKERNTKRFVQNWHSPCPLRQNGHDFFYRIYIFFLYLLCSWIIAIFKACLITGRNSHCLYAYKLYFNAWKLYQKWKKLQNVCYNYFFSMYSSSEVSYQHFQIKKHYIYAGSA